MAHLVPGPSYVSVGEVAPNLYVGAKPPSGPTLHSLGFSMLVLTAEEHQPPSSDFPGVEIVRANLLDNGTETPRDVLRKACGPARAVAAALARRRKVLVTCQWGYNRSGVVAGLALRMRGMTPKDVLFLLSRARPGHKGLVALGSPEYRQAMMEGCP